MAIASVVGLMKMQSEVTGTVLPICAFSAIEMDNRDLILLGNSVKPTSYNTTRYEMLF